MKIEVGTAHPGYWTVIVDPGELVVESGKALPYSAWIGVIRANGKIEVWTPAAYVPRGYRKAAQRMLEEARDFLVRHRHAVFGRATTRYATGPHSGCVKAGRCIEPVPDEEKCR